MIIDVHFHIFAQVPSPPLNSTFNRGTALNSTFSKPAGTINTTFEKVNSTFEKVMSTHNLCFTFSKNLRSFVFKNMISPISKLSR